MILGCMALHPDSGLRHGFASHHVEPSVFATVLKPTCLPPCVFVFIHVEYIIQAWPMRRVLCLKVPRFQEYRIANDQYFKVADSKARMLRLLFSFLMPGCNRWVANSIHAQKVRQQSRLILNFVLPWTKVNHSPHQMPTGVEIKMARSFWHEMPWLVRN